MISCLSAKQAVRPLWWTPKHSDTITPSVCGDPSGSLTWWKRILGCGYVCGVSEWFATSRVRDICEHDSGRHPGEATQSFTSAVCVDTMPHTCANDPVAALERRSN